MKLGLNPLGERAYSSILDEYTQSFLAVNDDFIKGKITSEERGRLCQEIISLRKELVAEIISNHNYYTR